MISSRFLGLPAVLCADLIIFDNYGGGPSTDVNDVWGKALVGFGRKAICRENGTGFFSRFPLNEADILLKPV